MFEALLLAAALAAELPDSAALLKQADGPRQALLHSKLQVRVSVEEDNRVTQSTELDVYLGDEDQQLVVFRDKKNQGRRFLTVGDKSWLIVPGSKNPIPVTANQRMVGASSFSDLARVRLGLDYTGTVRPGTEPCGEQRCRVTDITATAKSAPYASGTLWTDGDGRLRKAIYRLASGKPAKEIDYRYRTAGDGRTVPAGMTLNDLLVLEQPGKTTIEYLRHTPTRHPPATFDPQQQVKH